MREQYQTGQAKPRKVVVWNGKAFFHMAEAEAKREEARNRVQIMGRNVDGLTLKHPRSFAKDRPPPPPASDGYTPPELAKVTPAQQEQEPPRPATAKAMTPDPSTKAVQEAPMKDWRSYRKVVADRTGKAYNKVTKADVEEFLKELDEDDILK